MRLGLGCGPTSPLCLQPRLRPGTVVRAQDVGGWYDPADLSTLFQDRNGSTPVTAPGQPVGLVLDKSRGLAPGPELVINGSFGAGSTGWSDASLAPATATVANGVAVLTSDGVARARLRQTIPVTIGKTYRLTAMISGGSGEIQCGATAGAGDLLSTGAVTGAQVRYVTPTSSPMFLQLTKLTPAGSVTFDDVSVCEIAGTHLWQATAAARPSFVRRPRGGLRNEARGAANVASTTFWPTPITSGGITVEKVGWGVEPDGLPYVEYRATGTSTTSGQRPLYASSQGEIAATNGTTTTVSFFGRFTATPLLPANSGLRLDLQEFLSGSLVGSTSSSLLTSNSYSRLALTRTLSAGGTSARFVLGFRCTAGDVVDVTFRIKGLQHERGAQATAVQHSMSFHDVTEPGVPDCYGLSFDGVDDHLQTAPLNWGSDEVTLITALRRLSDSSIGTVAELGMAGEGFVLQSPAIAGQGGVRFGTRGSSGPAEATAASGAAVPSVSIVSSQGKIATDLAHLRLNGQVAASAATDQGNGIYPAAPLYIGRRAGTTLAFAGTVFRLIAVNRLLSPTQLASIEGQINAAIGAY